MNMPPTAPKFEASTVRPVRSEDGGPNNGVCVRFGVQVIDANEAVVATEEITTVVIHCRLLLKFYSKTIQYLAHTGMTVFNLCQPPFCFGSRGMPATVGRVPSAMLRRSVVLAPRLDNAILEVVPVKATVAAKA